MLLNRLAEADRTIQGFNVGVRKWYWTPIRGQLRDLPAWAKQFFAGSLAFAARHVPRRRDRPRSGTAPSQNQDVRA